MPMCVTHDYNYIYNIGIVRAGTDIDTMGDIIIPEGIYRCNVFEF
jgi:hypothetical protein